MNQPPATIRSGEKIPHFDGTNDHLIFDRSHWNKIIAAINSMTATRDWNMTEHGIALLGSSPRTTRYFQGTGDPSSTTLSASFNYISTSSMAAPSGPDFYFDITDAANPNMWVCITAGTNSTSMWAAISGGSGSAAVWI